MCVSYVWRDYIPPPFFFFVGFEVAVGVFFFFFFSCFVERSQEVSRMVSKNVGRDVFVVVIYLFMDGIYICSSPLFLYSWLLTVYEPCVPACQSSFFCACNKSRVL